MNIKRFNNNVIGIRSNNDEIKGGTNMINPTVQSLQAQLKINMSKAVRFAEKNTKRNSLGQVVLSSNDEWRDANEWNDDYDKNRG